MSFYAGEERLKFITSFFSFLLYLVIAYDHRARSHSCFFNFFLVISLTPQTQEDG